MDIKKIIELGLEETEAKVYLALLELGPSTVSEITKKAKITRTLGYHVLEKLAWKGLIEESQFYKGSKKMVYFALHPNRLEQYVKNQRNQWDKNLTIVDKILPDLTSLYKIPGKPTVYYKMGLEGVEELSDELLNVARTEVLTILELDLWREDKKMRNYGQKWDKIRCQRKIKERQLILDTPKAREWMKYFKGLYKFTQYKWIKPEQLPGISNFGGEINIYNNRVLMLSLKKPNMMGVRIESQSLSDVLRGMFELAWNSGVNLKSK